MTLPYHKQKELGEKIVASKYWSFSPGMLVIDSKNDQKSRLSYFKDNYWYTNAYSNPHSVVRYNVEQAKRFLPDLNDPATIGWSIAILRDIYKSSRGNDGILSTIQVNGFWGIGTMEQGVFAALVLPVYEYEVEAIVHAIINFREQNERP